MDPDREQYLAKKAVLLQLHEEASALRHQQEEEDLIARELDAALVGGFRTEVLEAWSQSGSIRRLAELLGAYDQRPGAPVPDGLDARGTKQLDPKGVFAGEEGVIYADWGGSYGRALAEGEDVYLSTEFLRLPEEVVAIEELDARVKDAIAVVSRLSNNPIVIISGMATRKALTGGSDFQPAWRSRETLPVIPGVEGRYAGAILIRIRGGIPENQVVVIDLRRFATLVQYPPDTEGSYPLRVSVELITRDRAGQLHEATPEFAKDPVSGQPLQGEAAARWFELHAIVEVSERIQFEEIDTSAGLRIAVRDIDPG